jgi:hypothetical protein
MEKYARERQVAREISGVGPLKDYRTVVIAVAAFLVLGCASGEAGGLEVEIVGCVQERKEFVTTSGDLAILIPETIDSVKALKAHYSAKPEQESIFFKRGLRVVQRAGWPIIKVGEDEWVLTEVEGERYLLKVREPFIWPTDEPQDN